MARSSTSSATASSSTCASRPAAAEARRGRGPRGPRPEPFRSRHALSPGSSGRPAHLPAYCRLLAIPNNTPGAPAALPHPTQTLSPPVKSRYPAPLLLGANLQSRVLGCCFLTPHLPSLMLDALLLPLMTPCVSPHANIPLAAYLAAAAHARAALSLPFSSLCYAYGYTLCRLRLLRPNKQMRDPHPT